LGAEPGLKLYDFRRTARSLILDSRALSFILSNWVAAAQNEALTATRFINVLFSDEATKAEMTMGDIAELPVDNQELVTDFARYVEGILTEQFLRRKYRFDDATWERLGDDDALVEAIEAEKVKRIRDGSSKREKSQLLVTKAPDVLGTIMMDGSASPKHRIDASKALDQFAGNGAGVAPAAERFVITINMGADVEHYNKSIEINANDTDPEAARLGLIPAVPTKKAGKER
jgi:hypothetical protein